MKLVAAMNVRNELDRYLTKSIPHLLTWCDEVRVQDDHSDDGTREYLESIEGVEVRTNPGPTWTEHEGDLHQNLLDWVWQGEPDAVIAIDADEFVPAGKHLRQLVEEEPSDRFVFCLQMVEIWNREQDPWLARIDGGWVPHDVGILYKAPSAEKRSSPSWKIWGRKMAGGRVPRVVRAAQRVGKCVYTGVTVLHLGWSNPAEREERHARYAKIDQGNYHAGEHIDSILWPDSRCAFIRYPDPGVLD